MKLILGGAHQGKLDYARKRYGPDLSVFQGDETRPEIDFSRDILNALHLTVLAQLRSGVETAEYLESNLKYFEAKIVICDDISSGIVPVDPEMRLWRETVGRALLFLSDRAEEVVRMFCGIGSRLK